MCCQKKGGNMKVLEGLPGWKKAVIIAFAVFMPFIGSINGIAY